MSNEETYDPFSPEGAHIASLITLMRIYDTLMALLTEKDADAARKLIEAHSNGYLLGPMPFLAGPSDESAAPTG